MIAAGASLLASRPGATPTAARQGGNPACAVLTVAEIRTATGFTGYDRPSPGDPPGQGAGGGASCQYEAPRFAVDAKGNAIPVGKGPLLSLVLIDGKNYTKNMATG